MPSPDLLESAIRNGTRILRYFAAPVAALVLLWLIDPDHDIIIAMSRTESGRVAILQWYDLGSWWPVIVFAAMGGLCVYHLHRAVAHPLIQLGVRAGLAWWRPVTFSGALSERSNLSFARWQRRTTDRSLLQGAVQAALDELNAACHFLYCTAWCLWIFSVVLTLAFGPWFDATKLLIPLAVYGLVLIVAALFYDVSATIRDIEAYNKFNSKSEEGSESSLES